MISFSELLERLDIMPQESRIKLPDDVQSMLVQFGGPVEPGRGFVLHTSDYFSADTSLPIDERVALTATLDILRAIAGGQGPRRSLLAQPADTESLISGLDLRKVRSVPMKKPEHNSR